MRNKQISAAIIYKLCTNVQSWIPSRSLSSIRAPLHFESINDYYQKMDGSRLRATLSDRQIQFWEDVDRGLHDLTERHDFNLTRVFEFGKSAREEIPPPEPCAPSHEPSTENINGLSAKPFWNAQSFSWIHELEQNYDIIRDELQSSLNKDKKAILSTSSSNIFASDSTYQNSVMGSGWSAFRLQRLGVWNEENCNLFPKTYQLLQSLDIPFAVRGVCFAKQKPNSGVASHSDGRNFILTMHFGLQIPHGCWIQVGNVTKAWENGKALVIDTSFLHSTANPTDEERHVLIIDFWHPDLTLDERKALEFVYDVRNQYETGRVPMRNVKKKFWNLF